MIILGFHILRGTLIPNSYVFNHSDDEVIFTGFVNEEEEEFQEVLKQA